MNFDKEQSLSSPPASDEPQAQHDPVFGSDQGTDATIIAKGITVSGDLCGTGTVLVEGTVIGKIALDDTVTVASTGIAKGPITADTVYVAGCVEGDITAQTCLHLKMTGSITGDVTVSSFTIEDGGYFNGRSQMTKSGGEPVILY